VIALDELRSLLAKSEERLARVFRRMIRAKVDGDPQRELSAREELQRLLGQALAVSNILGRRRAILEAEAASGHRMRFSVELAPFVPAVEFDEAIADLLRRYPALAPGYLAVQQLYAEGHAFALAKSTDEVLTRHVQKVLAESLRTGAGRASTAKVIAEMGDWTDSYVHTVYATNAATAYAAGRVQQAQDPDIAEVCPAFELVGRAGPPSRANHAAAVGLVAATDDPVWDLFMPPLGYNCSHGVRLLDRFSLQRRGLLRADGTVIPYRPAGFDAAHPDPGFGRGTLGTRLAISGL
jgi:hypothetical protein